VLSDIDGESFSGGCSTEYFDNSTSGTLGGGTISGSMTFNYKKGDRTGTTIKLRFSGSTRR
jgi:hypothetical protein